MTTATLERPVRPRSIARPEESVAHVAYSAPPLRERLRIIRNLRRLIAEQAEALAGSAAAVSHRSLSEKLVSEVLPLAEACRWLEKNARRVLASRRCGASGQPLWLRGVSIEVQRQALGVILVIGPRNYPLFLPSVHVLHALAAGNSVLLKPAPATRDVALSFSDLVVKAGFDPAALTILSEDVEAVHAAVARGQVAKVIFTGSSENGRNLLEHLARTNTPSVMELSGEDAVIVLADADLDLVARALQFGARLNRGNTCIAPRRIFAVGSMADALQAGSPEQIIDRVRDADDAAQKVNSLECALGASIFSRNLVRARALATQLKTGFVVVNDLIVPTADPRMPFGGIKASGFGTTRGDEGLLEMTFPHAVVVRRGRTHRHFDPPVAGDARLFAAYIRGVHGRSRLAAVRDFAGAIVTRFKRRKA